MCPGVVAQIEEKAKEHRDEEVNRVANELATNPHSDFAKRNALLSTGVPRRKQNSMRQAAYHNATYVAHAGTEREKHALGSSGMLTSFVTNRRDDSEEGEAAQTWSHRCAHAHGADAQHAQGVKENHVQP